ncbi:MAG: choice-of-anchor J domain-containing protein [Bacteroidales bacterium]|jgi:hypothetical protein|nr:choice-of-anchor J domain-containing protein [Bacteroidales bacterium]
MKKIIFSFLTIGCMVGVSAQTTVFSENFDEGIPATWTIIDADGDGSNWEAEALGRDGTNCAISISWDYNTYEALTPDNWLISPQISVPDGQNALVWYSDAYDDAYPEDKYSVYVSTTGNTPAHFTANAPVFTEVIQAGDWAMRGVDLSAYAGQNIYIAFRHHDCTDMYVMLIDDIAVINGKFEMLSVSSHVHVGLVQVGSSLTRETGVNAVGLTNPITVTTSAPFEVSNDGTSFASTATLPAEGGTLYIKFTPTAEGNAIETATLSSGETIATLSLTGTSYECASSYDLPFYDDFETNSAYCWTMIDADGDGDNWFIGTLSETETVLASYSYVDDNPYFTPDNWIVSPALRIPATGANIQWRAAAFSADFPEKYGVYVSTTNNDPNSFTLLFSEIITSEDFVQRTVNIPANFANQQVYIAFRHFESIDKYILLIDEVAVTKGGNSVKAMNDNDKTMLVYPNPARDRLTIVGTEPINRVEIIDLLGKTLYVSSVSNEPETMIDISKLARGTYVVRVQTAKGIVMKKVVME